MATLDQLTDQALTIAERLISDESFHEAVAARYAAADVILSDRTGKGAPPITSGYRPLWKQRELYRRWTAGDPGVIVRPARTSWHTEGRAIDVDRRHQNFDLFVAVWEALGGRWGGRFSKPDPVHFDVPGSSPPRPAYE